MKSIAFVITSLCTNLAAGGSTPSDFQNQASYTAKGTSIGLEPSRSEVKNEDGSTRMGADGKPLMQTSTPSSAGYGSDKGQASSVTTAAISGLAGNKEARTGDAEAAIKPIFDKDKVKADVAAQVQITTEFGRQASQAVGNYAQGQLKEAEKKRQDASQARQGGDSALAQRLEQEASQIEANWGEGKPARVALHAGVGLLGGGAQGALGAASSQALVPQLAQEIAQLDIPVEVKQALVQVAGLTLGAATGGQAGAATAVNATAHNFLTHTELKTRAEQQKACSAGQAKACQAVRELDQKSAQRNEDIRNGVLAVSPEQGAQILQDLQASMTGLQTYKAELQTQLDKTGDPQQRADLQNQINQADNNIRQVANLGKDHHYALFQSTQDPRHLAAFAQLSTATSGSELADAFMAGAVALGVNNKPKTNAAATPSTGDVPPATKQTAGAGETPAPKDAAGSSSPYEPATARADLEARHGAENVSSTTVANNPIQRTNSNPDKGVTVIENASGKAVQVEFKDPITGQSRTANIPYDSRGLPVFDDVAQFTTKIDTSLSRDGQMRQATRDLRDAINSGKVDASKFTGLQLKQIQAGNIVIKDFTWHHNAQSAPNNMQLVPTPVHNQVNHLGQGALSHGR
jgi:DNase/tRNase domain of colicin-like bacteriocin